MASIPLTEGYRLLGDPDQWIVQKRRPDRKDRPGPQWKTISYHRTLAHAMQEVYERGVREAETETLADLLVHAENLRSSLRAALRGLDSYDQGSD